MTRWTPALSSFAASGLALCLWSDRASAAAGGVAALFLTLLAQRAFLRTLGASWNAFALAFACLFAAHAACAGALLAICWTTSLRALPALSTWAAGVFAGTLAVGLTLPWKPARAGRAPVETRHAR